MSGWDYTDSMAKSNAVRLYDDDFFEWTRRNADLLRQGHLAEADLEHIAEEIEDMGKRDQRAAINHTVVLLIHLLKWKFQPERRSDSWTESIVRERLYLESLFDQSASLRNHVFENWDVVVKRAAGGAAREMHQRIRKSEMPAWNLTQVLKKDFLPK